MEKRKVRRIVAKRAVDTRRIYLFEKTTLMTWGKRNREGTKDRPLYWLRELAERIWKENNKHKVRWRCPEVTFGTGILWCGNYLSYCWGNSRIELAPKQRNAITLIHEMTHALGPGLHNRYFVRLYFYLLERYAGYNAAELESYAAWHNIKA